MANSRVVWMSSWHKLELDEECIEIDSSQASTRLSVMLSVGELHDELADLLHSTKLGS